MNIEVALIILVVVVITCVFLVQRKEKESDKRQINNGKTHSKVHRALINKPYSIQCKTEVFTLAELDIINKYGAWLSALASNQVTPETKEQQLFIEECHRFRTLKLTEMLSYFSSRDDSGSIQSVWFKYLCRIKFERENTNIVNTKTKVDWGWQGPAIESVDHVLFSK